MNSSLHLDCPAMFAFLRPFEAYIGSLEDLQTDKYSDKARGVEPQTAR